MDMQHLYNTFLLLFMSLGEYPETEVASAGLGGTAILLMMLLYTSPKRRLLHFCPIVKEEFALRTTF